jgi:four helix bundle protein
VFSPVDAELARFSSMAAGSASELEYHLLLARDLNLIPTKDYPLLAEQVVEIKRMLTGFLQTLSAAPADR